ncbi:MAG: type IV secretion system DNA-binding domain-containing protein [Minisyncoccia bacterium]
MPKAGKIQLIKYAPPPAELPVYGKVPPSEVSYVGRTNYIAALEEKRFVFGIKRSDRRRHVYIIGKSGMGKSKFLELLMRQDVVLGQGFCLIDPHGDLIEDILNFIPKNRIDDVCLIDPTFSSPPVLFNPLADVDPNYKHQFTESLIEILKKQFDVNWTPKVEYIFRFASLALLDCPGATMQRFVSLLTDEKYREETINFIKDETVRRFWAEEFSGWVKNHEIDSIILLVNKLNQLLSNPVLKKMFGSNENLVDLKKLVQDRKIILVNLAKGKLGEDASNFFGSVFIAKMKEVGMARVAVPGSLAEDFYFYIDEFNNLATETFENLLADSRKYGICMTIANQYLSQLSRMVQAAILGNVGTVVVFRISGEDAERLEAEMMPVFKSKDMINLGTQEFYIKMTIDGETYDPFSAETLKVLPAPHQSLKEEIIAASLRKYSVSQGPSH